MKKIRNYQESKHKVEQILLTSKGTRCGLTSTFIYLETLLELKENEWSEFDYLILEVSNSIYDVDRWFKELNK